jgi:hypothetical protein
MFQVTRHTTDSGTHVLEEFSLYTDAESFFDARCRAGHEENSHVGEGVLRSATYVQGEYRETITLAYKDATHVCEGYSPMEESKGRKLFTGELREED